MRFLFPFLVLLFTNLQAQTPKTLLVYLQCNSSSCSTTFLQEELPFLEFTVLPHEANVHVLITQQQQLGQEEVQMDFLGQGELGTIQKVHNFVVPPNISTFEAQELYLKHFKLGLLPFLLATGYADALDVSVDMQKLAAPVLNDKGFWRYSLALGGGYKSSIYKDTQIVYSPIYTSFPLRIEQKESIISPLLSMNYTTKTSKFGARLMLQSQKKKNKSLYYSLYVENRFNPITQSFENTIIDTIFTTSNRTSNLRHLEGLLYKTKNHNPYWASLVSFDFFKITKDERSFFVSEFAYPKYNYFIDGQYTLSGGIEYNLLGNKESARHFATISYVSGLQVQRFDTLSTKQTYGQVLWKNKLNISYSFLKPTKETQFSLSVENSNSSFENEGYKLNASLNHYINPSANSTFYAGLTGNYSSFDGNKRPLEVNHYSNTNKDFVLTITPNIGWSYYFGNTKQRIINRRWANLGNTGSNSLTIPFNY